MRTYNAYDSLDLTPWLPVWSYDTQEQKPPTLLAVLAAVLVATPVPSAYIRPCALAHDVTGCDDSCTPRVPAFLAVLRDDMDRLGI